MTKEEILAMGADDDLDRLVAVEVMDLFCVYEPPYLGWANREYWYDMYGRPANVRGYSTDILSAWRVVEKLTDQNLFCSLDYLREQHSRDGRGDWRCRVVQGVKIEFVCANAAPEAICKAALLAKLKA